MKELIINVDKQKNKTIALVENGHVVEKYETSNEQEERIEGKIYIGKIVSILKGMQVAFVNIGQNKNAFLHIRDIVPKESEEYGNKNIVFDDYDINKYVKIGMKVLVQVQRDKTENKGSRVSTHINMPGRYCAVIPNTKFVTVSQKITEENERKRLKKIAEKMNLNYGIILRTGAKNKSEEDITRDIEYVVDKIEKIQKEFEEKKDSCKNTLLYDNHGILEKIIMGIMDQDLNRIITNNNTVFEFVNNLVGKSDIEINKIDRDTILDLYDIEKQIEKSKNRKIWLKCGGFITIDKTEALTAIDVNSGKYAGKDSLNKSVLVVNTEAAIEIAKQLRLRDIGGIIVIDFIDMQTDEARKKVLEVLEQGLKNDRTKTQVVGFTKLDLVEMTRKHICS